MTTAIAVAVVAMRKTNMYFNRLVPTKRRPACLNAIAIATQIQRLQPCSYTELLKYYHFKR